jgi:hypothetical protein
MTTLKDYIHDRIVEHLANNVPVDSEVLASEIMEELKTFFTLRTGWEE